MKHVASLALGLMAVWLLWSGYWHETLLVTLGVLSVTVVLLLSRRMGLVDAEGVPVHILLRLVRYAPWLVWEVVKSNVDVARRILSPRLPISPTVIEVEATQRTDLGRVIYANSITLTPGTVSMAIDGTRIKVHALSEEAAEGVRGGEMDRRVTRLEGAD